MVMQSFLFTKKIPSIISSRTKSMKLCIFIWVLNPFQLALQSSLLHLFQGEVTCIMCIFTLLPLYLLWSLTDSYTYISHMEKNKTKQPTPSSLPPPQQAKQKNDPNTNKQTNPSQTKTKSPKIPQNKKTHLTFWPCIFVLVVTSSLGRGNRLFQSTSVKDLSGKKLLSQVRSVPYLCSWW